MLSYHCGTFSQGYIMLSRFLLWIERIRNRRRFEKSSRVHEEGMGRNLRYLKEQLKHRKGRKL